MSATPWRASRQLNGRWRVLRTERLPDALRVDVAEVDLAERPAHLVADAMNRSAG